MRAAAGVCVWRLLSTDTTKDRSTREMKRRKFQVVKAGHKQSVIESMHVHTKEMIGHKGHEGMNVVNGGLRSIEVGSSDPALRSQRLIHSAKLGSGE